MYRVESVFAILCMFVVLSFFLGIDVNAEGYSESWYQEKFCSQVQGEREVRLDDGTRVDCLTGEYAYELGFAKSWDSIPQALHYAIKTGRKPAIVLIVEDWSRDIKYIVRIVNYMQALTGQRIRIAVMYGDKVYW